MKNIVLSTRNIDDFVSDVANEVVKRMELWNNNPQHPTDQPEQLLTVPEAADFLHLKVASIYLKVSRGELPFMKRSKRLYFSSTELLEYIKEGRKKTNAEIEAEAESYLKNKGDADLHKNKIKPTKVNAL